MGNAEVVLLGFPGKSPKDAAAVLAQLFGIDVAKAAKIVMSAPVSVKRHATEADARQVAEALLGAGAQVELRVDGAVVPLEAPPPTDASAFPSLPAPSPEPASDVLGVDTEAMRPRTSAARVMPPAPFSVAQAVAAANAPPEPDLSTPHEFWSSIPATIALAFRGSGWIWLLGLTFGALAWLVGLAASGCLLIFGTVPAFVLSATYIGLLYQYFHGCFWGALGGAGAPETRGIDGTSLKSSVLPAGSALFVASLLPFVAAGFYMSSQTEKIHDRVFGADAPAETANEAGEISDEQAAIEEEADDRAFVEAISKMRTAEGRAELEREEREEEQRRAEKEAQVRKEAQRLAYHPLVLLLMFGPALYWPLGLARASLGHSVAGFFDVFGALKMLPAMLVEYLAVLGIGLITYVAPVVGYSVLASGSLLALLSGSSGGGSWVVLGLAPFMMGFPIALTHGVVGALMGSLLRSKPELVEG